MRINIVGRAYSSGTRTKAHLKSKA